MFPSSANISAWWSNHRNSLPLNLCTSFIFPL